MSHDPGDLIADVPEGPRVTTVDQLTGLDWGWLVKVQDPNPMIRHRTYTLVEHRSWEYQGKTTVGLTDGTDAVRPFIGTERHYAPDTPCEVLRRVKKARKARPAAARCSCGKPFPEDGGKEGVCECCSGCAGGAS